MTVIDEKLVAEKITSILEAYFPERISVDGLEAPTASFLAVWYLGRLFRHGIFCLSDVDAVGAPEAVIRVFLLGLTLADKWLNDGSRRLKDWFVHLGYTLSMVVDFCQGASFAVFLFAIVHP